MAEFRLTTGSDLFVGTNGRDLFTEVQAGGSDNLQGERGFDRFFRRSGTHISSSI